MNKPHQTVPELDTLSTGLESAITERGVLSGKLEVISRQPNPYCTTFPSEIISCRLSDKREIKLLCKYSADAGNEAHGHRGGVEYETEVYRHILSGLNLTSPILYGIYKEQDNERSGLMLEYLTESSRLSKAVDCDAMTKATRWIGKFHAISSPRLSSSALPFLKRYDPEYYGGWARRTLQMTKKSGATPRWLRTLCNRFDEVIEALCEAPSTIIHGEYYPKNILLQQGQIYPVDWESTAVGCGEIDLATLTEGWSEEITQKCELEYIKTRWPQGAPHDFHKSLYAARIYVQFRWLGDQGASLPAHAWRMDLLHKYAEEMDISV